MSFSLYQSKKFRNSWLVLGDLTPLSTVPNRHDAIYQTFQRPLASIKTRENPSNSHYCYSSCEKLKLVIFHLLGHVYGTTHILIYVFHTLCNMARQLWDALQLHEKTRNLGMSNLMKQMFYLGIIYILRNFAKGKLDCLPWRRKSLF